MQENSSINSFFKNDRIFKSKLYSAFKWLLMIGAYSFLIYKLLSFDGYDDFLEYWKNMPAARFCWLAFVFLLLPANWLLEAVKWRFLVSKIKPISLKEATKAVLAGVSTGFFTPNRLGEIIGRVVHLPEGTRKQGASLSVLSAFTQSIIKIICGVPALILFFSYTRQNTVKGFYLYIAIVLFCLLLFVAFYFLLPKLAGRLSHTKLGNKLNDFILFFTEYSFRDLFFTLLLALLRYVVYSLQFYFMLRFFGVDLDLFHAFIAIASNYLFLMFTPSFAFSEMALRGSYAVFFVGAYSDMTINIMLAGMGIWIVNLAIVMIIGSVIMMKSKL